MSEKKFVLICRDGWVRSRISPHGGSRIGRFFYRTPKVQISKTGDPFARLGWGGEKASYSLAGRIYRYDYRLMRSFFLARHTGDMMIWREGNPAAIDFNDEKWKTAVDRTAFVVDQVLGFEPQSVLMRPRKVDWAMLLLVAVTCLSIGLAVGQIVKR